MPDQSVDLIITSPPFLALRTYLPDDHPNKDKEIGTAATTPSAFIDILLKLTAEWRRLLTDHGSLVVELGDTYAPGGKGEGWPLAKSLTLIPESYRFALAYGINPHSGESSPAGQWRVRNVVRWVRPNPMVSALGDKFRPATSDLVIACISKTRYFDMDAVRQPHKSAKDAARTYIKKLTGHLDSRDQVTLLGGNPGGAPPQDWWKISTGRYKGAHHAVFPAELVTRPIKAMCPEEVCRECGEPRRRITEKEKQLGAKLRWTDCGHDNYRAGVVLDPFAGVGTTLSVAFDHGRDAIGIDLDERNAVLAMERVGMFMEVWGWAEWSRHALGITVL